MVDQDHMASRDLSPSASGTRADGGAHTPGPWSTDHICFDRKIPIRGGVTAYGRSFVIAHVNRPGSAYAGQDRANAQVIAAAPDMLEALLLLRSNPISNEAQKAMHAAIAKAVQS